MLVIDHVIKRMLAKQANIILRGISRLKYVACLWKLSLSEAGMPGHDLWFSVHGDGLLSSREYVICYAS